MMDNLEKKNRRKYGVFSVVLTFSVLLIIQGLYFRREIKSLKEEQLLQGQDIRMLGDAMGISVSGNSGVTVTWYGKKWVSYGDSITQMGGWQDYITEYFGFAEHVECGIGSSTFTKSDLVWYANPDGSYNSRYGFLGVTEAPEGTTEHEAYLSSADRINTQVPADADLVLINGGTNDAGVTVGAPLGDLSYPFDETTFKGAVAATVVRMQERCPNALIVLMSPLSGRGPEDESRMNENGTEPEYNELGLTTQDYAEAMREVAEYLSIPFIDLFGTCGINPFNRSTYISDIVHPSEEGQRAMARVVIGALDDMKPVEKK